MGLNPGSPGFAMPPAEDDFVREQKDIRRTIRENAAARTAEATSIGKGGILVKDGGSITVEAPGTIDLLGGAFAAATITASGTVQGATVQGGTINSTGDMSAVGPIYTPHGRATPVTTGYVGAWLNSDGRIGASVSSVVYKQDFAPADTDDLVKALLEVSLVRFRYIQTVEDLGDEAPWELGAIAEYFAAIGLGEYVFNNADGEPMGINYERLSIPLIAVVQRLHAEGVARDARLEELERRLGDAGL